LDRKAIERLLATEYQGLLVLLRRKAQDPQLAADMLNDALVTTLANFDSGRIADPSHIGGYVFQVALNLLRNHRRKFEERAGKRVEIDDDTLGDEAQVSAVEESWAQRVRRILEELPSSRDRLLLKRFYLDEHEKEAICGDLSLSPLQFDKIIFRAKRRMQTLLESRGLRKNDFFTFLFTGLGLALA
jgi:RNA polymerase sigma-70 factor (ECF subfamily)